MRKESTGQRQKRNKFDGKAVFKRRPFIFIIMPITPRDPKKHPALEYLEYLRRGFELSTVLIRRGYSVYCPATDFPYWLVNNTLTTKDIYEQDLGVVVRSDAVFLAPGWSISVNCSKEKDIAASHGIPSFIYMEDMDRFFKVKKGD